MKFTEPQLDQIREIVKSELSNALKDIDATLKELNEKIIVLEPIGGRIMTKNEAKTILLGKEGD